MWARGRRLDKASKMAQYGSKRASKTPGRRPRWLEIVQDGSIWPPTYLQEATRRPQEGPAKSAPRGPQESPKMASRDIREPLTTTPRFAWASCRDGMAGIREASSSRIWGGGQRPQPQHIDIVRSSVGAGFMVHNNGSTHQSLIWLASSSSVLGRAINLMYFDT